MSPTNHGGTPAQTLANNLIAMAQNRLAKKNLRLAKKLALEALDSDPIVPGADQILTIADVLLGAQNLINNKVNPYSILNLDPASTLIDTCRQYRRLTLLLASSPHLPFADEAYRMVHHAWDLLSDPSKKPPLDADLKNRTFWTACPSCFHVHEYDHAYIGCRLLCHGCRRAFDAAALAAAPPIVPGTNMYYCTWGFSPLGFPNGVEGGYTPFYPVDSVDKAVAPKKAMTRGYRKVVVKKKKAKKVFAVMPERESEVTEASPVMFDLNED